MVEVERGVEARRAVRLLSGSKSARGSATSKAEADPLLCLERQFLKVKGKGRMMIVLITLVHY